MSDFDAKNVNEQVNERLKKDFEHYRKTLHFFGGNIPIQALCVPKYIENALIDAGCIRVYDIFDRDLRKIKGIGTKGIDLLTSRLDEFFSVSL